MSQPFTLGVNYWPGRKAMGWWRAFDPGEVRADFAVMHDLGLDVARVFLLWDDFQPEPERVSISALRHLEQVCDLAVDHHLSLDVTFFVGHMSGPNWPPRWLLGGDGYPSPAVRQVVVDGWPVHGGYRNMFSDGAARQAARLLVEAVVSALRDHPGVGLWNLGNEPDLFAWPPDAAAGSAWVAGLAALIRGLGAVQPITCGLHLDDLLSDTGLRVHDVYAETDVAVMHAYPMYSSVARAPLDPDFVPFSCVLTSALCGRPVLMEEFGGPTMPPDLPSAVWSWEAYGKPRSQFMAGEQEFAAYMEAVLPRLVQAGATGAMLWCFSDYHPDLWNQPPCDEARHERHFGMLRTDGTLKPHTEVIRRFAASHPQVLNDPPRRFTLDVTPEEYYRDPAAHFARLYQVYLGQS